LPVTSVLHLLSGTELQSAQREVLCAHHGALVPGVGQPQVEHLERAGCGAGRTGRARLGRKRCARVVTRVGHPAPPMFWFGTDSGAPSRGVAPAEASGREPATTPATALSRRGRSAETVAMRKPAPNAHVASAVFPTAMA